MKRAKNRTAAGSSKGVCFQSDLYSSSSFYQALHILQTEVVCNRNVCVVCSFPSKWRRLCFADSVPGRVNLMYVQVSMHEPILKKPKIKPLTNL